MTNDTESLADRLAPIAKHLRIGAGLHSNRAIIEQQEGWADTVDAAAAALRAQQRDVNDDAYVRGLEARIAELQAEVERLKAEKASTFNARYPD